MKIRWLIAILFASVFITGLLYAGSVYYWTDENGVRHYSNTGIPNDVEAADVRPEEVPAPQASESSDISDTDREPADTPPAEGDAEQTDPDAEGEKRMDDRLAARAEKEKQRLESEIKKIKGLVHWEILYARHEGRAHQAAPGAAGLTPGRPRTLLSHEKTRCVSIVFPTVRPATPLPDDPFRQPPVTSSAGGSSGDANQDDAETPSP